MTFAPATRPIAPPAPAYDAAAFLAGKQKTAVKGISVFKRADRNAARLAALAQGRAELVALDELNASNRAAKQRELDIAWESLLSNEETAVLSALSEALEDNDAAAAAVGIDGSEVSLVTLVPHISDVPDRRPDLTAAGNLTLKRLTKRETSDFYKVMVCGLVLVAVKEALAVAPGLTHVRIVALRAAPSDAYGKKKVEVIMAARFARARLDGIRWDSADSPAIVNDANDELVARQVGVSKELGTIDLGKEPDLAALVGAVDIEELVG